MDTVKIIEWNIHGAGGYGNYSTPNFIVNKILSEKVDIVIIVEFIQGNNWGYLGTELEKDYELFISPYSNDRNQVMSALKKESKFIVENVITVNPIDKNKPEFLQIETVFKETPLTIIGVRIKTQGNYSETESQFEFLRNHLMLLSNKNVLCAGDFNVWKNPLSQKLAINLEKIFTPEYSMRPGDFSTLNTWSAVIKKLKNDKGSKALIDHIVGFGMDKKSVKLQYDWDFVTNDNGYGDIKQDEYKSHLIGLPDHAILFAEFKLNNKNS